MDIREKKNNIETPPHERGSRSRRDNQQIQHNNALHTKK